VSEFQARFLRDGQQHAVLIYFWYANAIWLVSLLFQFSLSLSASMFCRAAGGEVHELCTSIRFVS
jgi:hypothetical protein